MSVKNDELKNLNLNPLSVAKHFWSKEIEVSPVIQQLIYFTYQEALKDGYLLFEEKWQAWPNGSVVESAFDRMFDNYDKLDKLFAKVKDLDNELVLNYADKVFKKYAKKSEVKSLIYHSDLYQLSIPNTEIRLIGDLKRNYFYSKENPITTYSPFSL